MSGLSLEQRIAARGLAGTLQAFATAHAVTVACILGRGRTKSVTEARRAFMLALRDRGLSLPEIGHLTGRTHSTVLDYVSPDRREKARVYASRRRSRPYLEGAV